MKLPAVIETNCNKSYHIALRIGAVFLFVFGTILSRPFIAEPIVRFFTSDENGEYIQPGISNIADNTELIKNVRALFESDGTAE